jgi:hypothetical protein
MNNVGKCLANARHLQLPKVLFKKRLGLVHVPFDVCLEVAGPGLPIIGRVSDPARQKDELV